MVLHLTGQTKGNRRVIVYLLEIWNASLVFVQQLLPLAFPSFGLIDIPFDISIDLGWNIVVEVF